MFTNEASQRQRLPSIAYANRPLQLGCSEPASATGVSKKSMGHVRSADSTNLRKPLDHGAPLHSKQLAVKRKRNMKEPTRHWRPGHLSIVTRSVLHWPRRLTMDTANCQQPSEAICIGQCNARSKIKCRTATHTIDQRATLCE